MANARTVTPDVERALRDSVRRGGIAADGDLTRNRQHLPGIDGCRGFPCGRTLR